MVVNDGDSLDSVTRREAERGSAKVLIPIAATALAVAGGLGYLIGHSGSEAPNAVSEGQSYQRTIRKGVTVHEGVTYRPDVRHVENATLTLSDGTEVEGLIRVEGLDGLRAMDGRTGSTVVLDQVSRKVNRDGTVGAPVLSYDAPAGYDAKAASGHRLDAANMATK